MSEESSFAVPCVPRDGILKKLNTGQVSNQRGVSRPGGKGPLGQCGKRVSDSFTRSIDRLNEKISKCKRG